MKKKKLLTRFKEEIRRRNYSYRTEVTYTRWVVRYVRFHGLKHPSELNETDVVAFLNDLANRKNVAASTQNQALSAIVFLYKHILKMPFENLDRLKRAKKSSHMPVVLTEQEARSAIAHLDGVHNLITCLLYGAGLRISEALRLRILDIDFGYHQIVVRNGKGLRDRITVLPESIKTDLINHLEKVRRLHQSDLEKGFGETILPKALAVKYPNASKELKWQYLFPSKKKICRSPVRYQTSISYFGKRRSQISSFCRKTMQYRKKGYPTYFSPFFCYVPLKKRLRHPNCPGTTGSQKCKNHHDLHPRSQPWRKRCKKPAGCIKKQTP